MYFKHDGYRSYHFAEYRVINKCMQKLWDLILVVKINQVLFTVIFSKEETN